jgi:hypothetical protein
LESLHTKPASARGWTFSRGERIGLVIGLIVVLAFGANLEQRTALRRSPMTDLGVFSCASWGVWHGENVYAVSDWHGWHYHYPPTLAILFWPLAHPLPAVLPVLAPGEARTAANTPWGYGIEGQRKFFGLHRENLRFFCIVAVWYAISIGLFCLSAHALACALEGRGWKEPPPSEAGPRGRWWALRTLPLLVCAGSVGTELSRGQVDVVVLAAIALALYLAARGRNLRAGLWLSIPAVVKLFPPLIILYPVWRGRWRMAAGMIAGLVLALAVLPAVTLGTRRTVELYHNWTEVLAKPALGQGADTSRATELINMNGTDNQSLLAFLHNWRYHDVQGGQRPAQAAPAARTAVYWVGGLMLVGIGVAAGLRRQDSPRQLVILIGLLTGLALVVNPIVHNFYYLLLLPLVAALMDRRMENPTKGGGIGKFPMVVVVFMVVDLLARLPTVGGYLRDLGLPLLSLVAMMGAGAILLRKPAAMAAPEAIR